MDQIKEIFRQAIKYRFWIAVCIAALMPVIAYAVGSGPVKAQAAAEVAKIKQVDSAVQKFITPGVPNGQYKEIVEEEKQKLSQDVQQAWKKLYARQSALLSWPKNVEERFQTWGRKWPENVDASAVQLAIIDYVTAYPKYVTEVYNTFRPFNPTDGTGIVAAPPEPTLLKPAPFTIQSPPSLGQVWAAQERLWVQRTLLQVIDRVNKDAKDWNTAVIKQINLLEVGNTLAQDQPSIAKGEVLELAPPIVPPGSEGEAAAAPAEGAMAGGMPGEMGAMGPTQAVDPDAVYYIHTESNQYKILPVQMSVLIEQDYIQDLLVELENSPLAIQVIEFEMAKPSTRVVKPEQGWQGMDYMAYSSTMQGMMMPQGVGMPPMQAFGGMYSMGSLGAMSTAPAGRTGVDVRGTNRAARRKEEEEKAAAKKVRPSIHDPYYYVVEVTIYGQARFYNPPPAEEPGATGQGEETSEAAPP